MTTFYATQAGPVVSPLARYGHTGLLIPYYFYPNNPYTDVVFQSLITLIRQYHQVPCLVVLNQPGSTGTGGPGPYDGNYAAAIRLLQGAGAVVLGYVASTYAARPAVDVQTDIGLWHTLYDPPVDGVFMDEFPYAVGTGNANITLYAGYYAYAQVVGHKLVVGNPGTNQAPDWYLPTSPRSVDIMFIAEGVAYPSVATVAGAFVGGHGDYDYRLNGILVYAQAAFGAPGLATFQTLQPYVQWFWVNDLTLPNPWGGLPPYLAELFAACAA